MSESDRGQRRHLRSQRQEEKSQYLQFYHLMINVEKTLFYYQDLVDQIFVEDVLDILTPECFFSSEGQAEGTNVNDSLVREEASVLARRKRQFLHRFVRFRNGGNKDGERRARGSRCPICTNSQYNDYILGD